MCCLSCVGVNGDREVSTLLGPGQSSHTHSRHFHSALLLLCESQICVRSFTGKGIGVYSTGQKHDGRGSELLLPCSYFGVHLQCMCHLYTYIHIYIHTYTHTYIHTYTYSHTYIHTYTHTYIIYCIPYSSDAGGNNYFMGHLNLCTIRLTQNLNAGKRKHT